jgi:3-phosphoshikimate 1-carboxyvinyltransferase
MSTKDQRPLRGSVRVPGDKSISHRALLLGALGRGRSVITGINLGADVLSTVAAIRALSVVCELDGASARALVDGDGWDGLREPRVQIDAGNSGTTLRTVLGLCAGVDGFSVLTGDETLRRRPMRRVVDPLRAMGARIDGAHHGDRAPVAIRGGQLNSLNLQLTVASAQVKTAILIAGLRADGRSTVTEPVRTRDHTEQMLAVAGAPIERSNRSISVSGVDALERQEIEVPGDFSAAVFPIAAAAIVPGSDLAIEGVGLNPTRTGALDVLQRMGADVQIVSQTKTGGELVGDLRVRASNLSATEISGEEIPLLIDELPMIAVLASFAEGETVIRDAGELRVKESDRISVLVANLRARGGDAEELPDGLVVRGPRPLTGGEVESMGDHRIAMSFAVAGLVLGEQMFIKEWSSVETSFPGFEELIERTRS